MSYTSIPPTLLSSGILRGRSMAQIGKTVATVVGAGLLGAVYQLMVEESRTVLQGIRQRSRLKAGRRDTLLIELLGSELSPALQLELAETRNPYEQALLQLRNPRTSVPDRLLLRETLQKAIRPI